jgi:hypothetical protein
MNRETKEKIESFAWNCTVGAGRDPEECDEPDKDTLKALIRIIERDVVSGEENAVFEIFCRAWHKCVQEMQQP